MSEFRVFVDGPSDDIDLNDLAVKGMRPVLQAAGEKVLVASSEGLTKGLNATLNSIVEAISGIELTENKYDIDEVTFTIGFDAAGEVGLVSFAKGSLTGRTGLQFKLKRNV
jgi:hypothetical protein